jgi:hypothetical protein
MNPTQAAPEMSLESLVAHLSEEFMERLKRGESFSVEEYVERHPQHAGVLRDVLTALQFMHLSGTDSLDTVAGSKSKVRPGLPLGDYRLVREIGRGGMGVVYEAEQISLGRRVALKVLPFAAALDAKQLQRFKNEAQAAAHLHHTNIVPVFGVGCERSVHYYAMQYIEGQTLAAVIRDLRQMEGLEAKVPEGSAGTSGSLAGELISGRWAPVKPSPADVQATGPYPSPAADQAAHSTQYSVLGTASTAPVAALSTERSTKNPAYFHTVAHLGIQAAEALEHAHQLGVVHRDIKPANLLIDPSPLTTHHACGSPISVSPRCRARPG